MTTGQDQPKSPSDEIEGALTEIHEVGSLEWDQTGIGQTRSCITKRRDDIEE
jgi:hypothetical protein